MTDALKTTYTLAEAARLLSCHAETLRRAIRDGSLQAARLGRGFRISRADLQTFWSERGGGALFGQAAPEAPKSAQAKEEPPKKEGKNPKLPQQLTLPT